MAPDLPADIMDKGTGPPNTPSKDSFSSFAKGVLAGMVLANFNKHMVLGVLCGSLAGAFYQQEYGLPSVTEQLKELKSSLDEKGGKN
eukprot:m.8190 g.8190  ORF g.8190 m.8190 type:complete len:87 (-) comp6901_c0_seq1:137-397(-)